MKEDPYTAPQAKLAPSDHQIFRWKSAAAAASVPFLGLPVIVVLLSVARGMDPPAFLLDPGFLGTLALLSVLAACALERVKHWTWLHWLLTTIVSIFLLGATVVILHAITR